MRLPALVLLLACAAGAQSSNGIVVSVTRVANLTADEADFNVAALTPLDTTQAQVIQILQDLGAQNPVVTAVTAGQSTAVYPALPDSQVLYQISFSAAPGAMKDLVKKLDAVRNSPPPMLSLFQFSVALGASQAALDAAHANTLPQLLSDARAKAQTVASAAGLRLGAIQGVVESASGFFYSSSSLFNSLALGGVTSSTSSGSGTQYTFYATVTFGVSGQ